MNPETTGVSSTLFVAMEGMACFNVTWIEAPCTDGYIIITEPPGLAGSQNFTNYGNFCMEVVGVQPRGVDGLNRNIVPVAGTCK